MTHLLALAALSTAVGSSSALARHTGEGPETRPFAKKAQEEKQNSVNSAAANAEKKSNETEAATRKLDSINQKIEEPQKIQETPKQEEADQPVKRRPFHHTGVLGS